MPSDSTGARPAAPRRWYRKKRTWAVVVLLAVLGLFFVPLLALRIYPRWFVNKGLKWTHTEGKFDAATWQADGSLRIDKFSLGDYLRTDYVEFRFNWLELLRDHRLKEIDIHEPEVWLSKIPKSGGLSGGVDTLRIFNGTLSLDNLGADMPTIPVRVGSTVPVVLNNISIGGARMVTGLDKEQTLTIDNISITSPFDALAPVLEFKAINITFTWSGILNYEIKKLQIVGPKIYIGPDLFWFVDEFKKQESASTTSSISKPWKINQVEVQAGQLAISGFGQPGVTLPFYFMTEGQEARLDRLGELPLKVKITIPPQDHSYPNYKVELKHLRGEIAFALPLTEHNAQNVVPTVYFDEVSWNGIAATKAWTSLTCDKTGIYGKMGGECNGGYLSSEFTIYFKPEYPWRGTFSATKIAARPIADQVAGNYVALDGVLRGQMAVEGRSREIVRSNASLTLDQTGRLEIKSLDKLLDRIPATWNLTKQDVAKILINTFRVYDYTAGELKLDYQLPDSSATLSLRGAQGARTFHVNWHQTPAETKVSIDE